jgi:hypothetical protein
MDLELISDTDDTEKVERIRGGLRKRKAGDVKKDGKGKKQVNR